MGIEARRVIATGAGRTFVTPMTEIHSPLAGTRNRDRAIAYRRNNGTDFAETGDDVFPRDYSVADGRLHCGKTLCHDADIDESLAAKYPYKPAYLLVARLEDGTMRNYQS